MLFGRDKGVEIYPSRYFWADQNKEEEDKTHDENQKKKRKKLKKKHYEDTESLDSEIESKKSSNDDEQEIKEKEEKKEKKNKKVKLDALFSLSRGSPNVNGENKALTKLALSLRPEQKSIIDANPLIEAMSMSIGKDLEQRINEALQNAVRKGEIGGAKPEVFDQQEIVQAIKDLETKVHETSTVFVQV